MRQIIILSPLFILLAIALWFAGSSWVHLSDGEPIPLWGWLAIAGGVVFSLLIGGGLMALAFYSSRHGYDEGADGRFRNKK
jgi:hypothetical protein